ncbi:hypothetical protein TNCV_1599401 [Trichonephila clavipes]|nr:hypothetical protein TNCV_1599401 [Trichonephila clavipes]
MQRNTLYDWTTGRVRPLRMRKLVEVVEGATIAEVYKKSLAIRLLKFSDRSFLTLADGAKYSLLSRGKSRLQISTLRSRVKLTDSNCSRREVKADYRYPHCAHGCSSQIPTALVESLTTETATGSSTVGNSTAGDSTVTAGGVTGNKTSPSNKTFIPFKGSMIFHLFAKKLNISTTLDITFNGTVGNPKGDKINVTVSSPKNKTISFVVEPFVLDKQGKPLTPKNSTKDYYQQIQNNEFFNEWSTYETYRNTSEGNSTDNPSKELGVICFKLP